MQFPITKFKVQLRLAIQRLRLYQDKQGALNAKARRDISGLLEAGKTESARIRVEGIIREDYNIEAMELVELSCELLKARIGLMEQARALDADDGVSEAAASIIYASTRLDVKELVMLREMLVAKYGKDAVLRAMDGKDANVSPRLLLKLDIKAPPQDLVTSYLREIALAYNVAWRPDNQTYSRSNSDTEDDGPPSGAVPKAEHTNEESKNSNEEISLPPVPDAETKSSTDDAVNPEQGAKTLSGTEDNTQPGDQHTSSPSPRTLPVVSMTNATSDQGGEKQKSAVVVPKLKKTPNVRSPGPAVSKTRSKQADDGLPSLEELQQRFEALKRP
ncbi:Vacuolar protein sorting-associated protein ist1 [Coemansia sp. RSA 1933]|nr:Vacuolar protein sorting-associated protein ist1 [Coemansia sp. RSA 1933]